MSLMGVMSYRRCVQTGQLWVIDLMLIPRFGAGDRRPRRVPPRSSPSTDIDPVFVPSPRQSDNNQISSPHATRPVLNPGTAAQLSTLPADLGRGYRPRCADVSGHVGRHGNRAVVKTAPDSGDMCESCDQALNDAICGSELAARPLNFLAICELSSLCILRYGSVSVGEDWSRWDG